VVEKDVWPTQPFWSAFVDAELAGQDVALWRAARTRAQEPTVPAIARLLVQRGLAESLVRAGERAAAAEAIERLRADADAVGAGLLRDAADRLEADAGLASRTSERTDDDTLTAREAQVLELVAEGLSNGQIAERLYISRKTVSVHVSSILRKTGAASRTEAVRLAAR
jgi:DNA-binding NarL/FixJ family response regulator